MTSRVAEWNPRVTIHEQTQTKGPLRATSDAYADGWERCFGARSPFAAAMDDELQQMIDHRRKMIELYDVPKETQHGEAEAEGEAGLQEAYGGLSGGGGEATRDG